MIGYVVGYQVLKRHLKLQVSDKGQMERIRVPTEYRHEMRFTPVPNSDLGALGWALRKAGEISSKSAWSIGGQFKAIRVGLNDLGWRDDNAGYMVLFSAVKSDYSELSQPTALYSLRVRWYFDGAGTGQVTRESVQEDAVKWAEERYLEEDWGTVKVSVVPLHWERVLEAAALPKRIYIRLRRFSARDRR